MIWSWRYEDAKGGVLTRPESAEFASQSDAESWLGENWRQLLAQGVTQVTLIEDGVAVYGPMGLNSV